MNPSVRDISTRGLAVMLVFGLAAGARSVTAQGGASTALAHSCADCHMRDHDALAIAERDDGSRVTYRAIIAMVPGLDTQSANCLECHSTEEQRIRRNAASRQAEVPVRGGAYLGFQSPSHHPLGTESRLGRDGARRIGDQFRLIRDMPGRRVVRDIPDEVTCAACHDPHEYDLRLGVSDDERTVCLSCHDPAFYAFSDHITPTCGDCHQQHNAPGPNLTREMDADALCAACHEGSGRMAMNRVDPSLHGPPTHVDMKPGRCSDCHKIHGDPGGM